MTVEAPTATRRIAAVGFGLLVLATFAAFFVSQRLKQAPKAVEATVHTRVFSPNGDGRQDQARFTIRLDKADDVTLTVLDRVTDRPIRRLATERPVPADRDVTFTWDGRRDDGRLAPDAYYKLLVTLNNQGRSAVANKRFILDTAPPRPTVTALGPGVGPVISPAPGGDPSVRVRISDPGLDPPAFTVYRTDTPRVTPVARFGAPKGAREARWDGLVDGRRPEAGTYAISARTREHSGTVGESPSAQALRDGRRIRGRPGVTVRYLAAVVPDAPIRAGERFEAFVDARGGRYRWELRRIGSRRPVAEGVTGEARLAIRVPEGASGAHLLVVRTSRNRYQSPITVAGERARPVLVVLPAVSWQGRNPVDGDGDGVPDTLDRTQAAQLARPFANDGLPLGFATQEGALLTWLLRRDLAHEITTDAALAAGEGPRLTGHEGVVLAGEPRWLPAVLQARLRRFAEDGGTVLVVGTDSLRRTVRLRGDTLDRPSPAAPEDVFAARLGPVQRRPVELVTYEDDPELDLFEGTAGLIAGYDAFEVSRARGLRSAAGPQLDDSPGALSGEAGRRAGASGEGEPVIAATRFGRGLVLRTGLPEWSVRLNEDPTTSTVGRRMWAILSS